MVGISYAWPDKISSVYSTEFGALCYSDLEDRTQLQKKWRPSHPRPVPTKRVTLAFNADQTKGFNKDFILELKICFTIYFQGKLSVIYNQPRDGVPESYFKI